MIADVTMNGENGSVVLVQAHTERAALFLLEHATSLAQEIRGTGPQSTYLLGWSRAAQLHQSLLDAAIRVKGTFIEKLQHSLTAERDYPADLRTMRSEGLVTVMPLTEGGLRFLNGIGARDLAIRVISGRPNIYVFLVDVLGPARNSGLKILEVEPVSVAEFRAANINSASALGFSEEQGSPTDVFCSKEGCALQVVVVDSNEKPWCSVHGRGALSDPRREQHPRPDGNRNLEADIQEDI